jgi:hypothetical protein
MYTHKNQRGRPWKHHSEIDHGTEELQQKKQAAAQGNPTLAESLLGILYDRQFISQPLYEAGRFFGELGYRYEPCLGHKFRQNASILTHTLIHEKGSNPLYWSEEQDERRTMAWRQALAALKHAGETPYQVVLYVVFCDQDLYTFPLSKTIPYVRPLQRGLARLEMYFKGEFQGKQDKHCDRASNLDQATRFQRPLAESRSASLP